MTGKADLPALRETLRVVSLDAGKVQLSGDRSAACTACAARAGCGMGALSEMIGGAHELQLAQSIPLSVGEDVTVAMSRGAFLGAVVTAYLLPAAALAIVAMAASVLNLSDISTALLCLPALALALLPLRRAERREAAASALWLEASEE